ncbi:MAG: EF-Tu/IF-2/RF-3 family GTPase [Methanomassiliicoccales archaeon]
MANLNVVVLGPIDYAKDLGKKGTTSDITLYDMKKGADTVSLLEATKYPERLAPLFYACSMADAALIVVDELTPSLGEGILMLDSIGIHRGWFVLRNYIPKEKIAPMLKGTSLEHFEFIADDKVFIREMLLEIAADKKEKLGQPYGSVPIDHFFNVKGVGTVVLGHVVHGSIKKHDNLKVLPTKAVAQVRSIQKHDDDFAEAGQGDRVGLALKNVEAEELDRGYVLSNDPDLVVNDQAAGELQVVKYWPTPLKEGTVLHVGHWMQFVPGRLESYQTGADWRKGQAVIRLDRPLVRHAGDRAVVTQLDGAKLRMVGTIIL